ncbi:MAG: LysR family transcriptional regulator [Peptococcaceae bacterium]|nr:LysR family transcriptional regulator [Peptococcaceae bacterium]
MIKTESLLYLSKVAQYNSISAAANDINITPSAITHSLKQLEDELGLSLYERTSKGIHLTADGMYIAQMAESVLNELRNMKQYAEKQMFNSKTTTLNGHAILCSFQMLNEALTPLYFDILKTYPHFSFSLSEISSFNKLLSSISEDDEIFGLFYAFETDIKNIFQQYPLLEYKALTKSFFSLRFSKNSSLVSPTAKEISWKEVAELPLIMTSDSSFTNNSLVHYLGLYNTNLNISYAASNTTMYLESLKNDFAASVTPNARPLLGNDEEQIYKTIPIRGDELYVSLIFVYNKCANTNVINTLIYKLMHIGI